MDMAVVMDGAIAAAAGTTTDGAEVVATIMVGGIATEVEDLNGSRFRWRLLIFSCKLTISKRECGSLSGDRYKRIVR
jgi:hypothetical protein